MVSDALELIPIVPAEIQPAVFVTVQDSPVLALEPPVTVRYNPLDGCVVVRDPNVILLLLADAVVVFTEGVQFNAVSLAVTLPEAIVTG